MSAAVVPTAADYQACLTEPSQIATTRRGPVEYAERGTGPPVLSLHASPAAFEHGLLLAEFARVNGFRVIAPSRPGYAATPLGAGRTPVEQADTLAALLDTLQLDRVSVLGMSGGGPAGYALAGTHPDRVTRLLQVESIALPATAPRVGRLGLHLTPVATVAAWMLDRFPTRMLTSMGAPPTNDPDQQAAQTALARGIITTATGWDRLGPGYDNDATQTRSHPPVVSPPGGRTPRRPDRPDLPDDPPRKGAAGDRHPLPARHVRLEEAAHRGHGLPGVSTVPQADRPAHPRPDGHRRRPRVRVSTRHDRPSYLEATDAAVVPRSAYPAGLGHGHRSGHLQPGHPAADQRQRQTPDSWPR